MLLRGAFFSGGHSSSDTSGAITSPLLMPAQRSAPGGHMLSSGEALHQLQKGDADLHVAPEGKGVSMCYPAPMTLKIYIDADACPVKEETYKVAIRYGLQTFVISNSHMQIPTSPLITRIIVAAGADAADDWIVEHVAAGDVVVTSDIPLAARVLAREAHAIAPYGRAFTEDSIGLALAQRSLMEHIRSTGETTGGPPPFSVANRSRFLQALDQAIARERRKRSLA